MKNRALTSEELQKLINWIEEYYTFSISVNQKTGNTFLLDTMEKLTSPSTLLKFLNNEIYDKIPQSILNIAAIRGKNIAEAIAESAKMTESKNFSITPKQRQIGEILLNHMEKDDWQLIAEEIPLISKTYKIHGFADFLLYKFENNKHFFKIVELKTRSQVKKELYDYKSELLQLYFYYLMFSSLRIDIQKRINEFTQHFPENIESNAFGLDATLLIQEFSEKKEQLQLLDFNLVKNWIDTQKLRDFGKELLYFNQKKVKLWS